jgi:DNA repair protein RadC
MAHQQISEVQVVYSSPITVANRVALTSSTDAYKILLELWEQDTMELQETFNVMLLNRANEVLGIYRLSKGSVSGTLVDPKLVFSVALKGLASVIILAHNHPSGTLKPSSADIELTRKLVEGGKLLDIQIVDHIIVTRHGYYSFADEGMIP